MALNSYQAKQIPMADVLARLGLQPQFEKKRELWYLSPFRHETVPSFKVNVERNIWYDFGEGQGGNVLDFVMKYRQLGTIADALRELDTLTQGGPLPLFTPTAPRPVAKPAEVEVSPPAGKVKQLHNRALLNYLSSRGISAERARLYVQEIYYQREGKSYFALAFRNDAGGYELRNPYFQGTHGAKDITLLPTEESICTGRRVAVFEGFIDFLSALALDVLPHPRPAVLVLNSNALRDRAVAAINRLADTTAGVDLYLDHDKSGQDLVQYFREALVGFDVVDRSGLYAGHKDVNEYLTGQQRAASR